MQKQKKSKTVPVIPGSQVVITGKKLTSEQREQVMEIVGSEFCVSNWIGKDGDIGHLDAMNQGMGFERFRTDFEKLRDLMFLDIGITLMNGPPGTPVFPVASYALKHGVFCQKEDVHFSHPAPRRQKKIEV